MSTRGTWTIAIGGDAFATTADVISLGDAKGGPNILEIPGYGAAAPLVLDLANLRVSWPLTMTRDHDTDADAYAWYFTAAAVWAGAADVVLTHANYGGTVNTYTFTAAKVELEVAQPVGKTTTTRITLTGGVPALS